MTDPKAVRKRLISGRRLVRLAAAVVLLAWFSRFAYVRYTTMPPGARSEPTAIADDDATADLVAAVMRLPSFATGTAPTSGPWAFAGTQGELSDALRGEWTPQSRPFLTKIIKHITTPKVNAVLDDLVEVSNKKWTLTSDSSGWSARGGIGATVTAWELVETIAALTVRARYRQTAQNDVTGAMSDLLAGLRLCRRDERLPVWGPSVDMADILAELRFTAIENNVSREESARVMAYILNELPRSLSVGMLASMGLEGDVAQILDKYYTDDGNGDGWLAVSVVGKDSAVLGADTGRRSPLWNVLSPLFNGRADVSRKFEQFYLAFGRVDELGFDAGLAEFRRLQSRRLFNVTDGPFVLLASGMNEWTYRSVVKELLDQRSAIIALALSAYKNDHEQYPASLEQLTPQYIDRVPLDVLTAKPFKYQSNADGYSLNEGQTLPEEIVWSYAWGIGVPSTGPPPIYAPSRPPPAHEPAAGGGN